MSATMHSQSTNVIETSKSLIQLHKHSGSLYQLPSVEYAIGKYPCVESVLIESDCHKPPCLTRN